MNEKRCPLCDQKVKTFMNVPLWAELLAQFVFWAVFFAVAMGIIIVFGCEC